MKNFKKVLALVLVVVMAMSLITVSNAAFTDAASINHTEAVEVLNAIGVIAGFEDGSFKPGETVTRGQMAKMIATILNQGEDVGEMYKGACTFADTANHWAAGYVAFCAQEKIINGKNATTFAPDATVTGTEAAKMMLGALGHAADKAGLVGSAWASTTLSLAKKYQLIGEQNNLVVNMNAPLTREAAAQLMLNGLKATMVEYKGGTDITIGNVTLNQGAEAKTQANYTGHTYNGSTAQVVVDDAGTKADALQLIEQCFPKLDTDPEATADAFGRKVNTWKFENTTVGSYYVAPTLTYTTAVTLGQLYTDLGKVGSAVINRTVGNKDSEGKDITSDDPKYYVDGKEFDSKVEYKADLDDLIATGENLKFTSGESDWFIGGQGVQTEVYYDELTYALRVVEINTYATKVSAVFDAKKDANGDVTMPAYITLNGVDTVGATLADGVTKLPANAIAAEGFTRADQGKTYVAYTKGYDTAAKKDILMSVEKATVVSGTNKGATKIGETVVSVNIDATTHPVNANYKYDATKVKPGNSETVYLDGNGNIIATSAVASSDYVLVLNAGANDWTDTTKVQAYVLKEDGTVGTIDLDQASHTDATKIKQGMYRYVVNSEGKYTLEKVQEADHISNEFPMGYVNAGEKITNKAPSFDGKVMNANTVFVIGEVANGVTTYSTYTGIAAVPTFSAAEFKDKDGNGLGKYAQIFYACGEKGTEYENIIETVFCVNVNLDGIATSNVVALFKTGNESVVTDATGASYAEVKAIVDGQITTVKVDATSDLWTKDLKTNNKFLLASSIKTAATGYVTGATQVDAKYMKTFTNFSQYTDGVMSFTIDDKATGMFVDTTVPVYVYNTTAKALQQSSVEALYKITEKKDMQTGAFTTDMVTGAITGIYTVID